MLCLQSSPATPSAESRLSSSRTSVKQTGIIDCSLRWWSSMFTASAALALMLVCRITLPSIAVFVCRKLEAPRRQEAMAVDEGLRCRPDRAAVRQPHSHRPASLNLLRTTDITPLDPTHRAVGYRSVSEIAEVLRKTSREVELRERFLRRLPVGKDGSPRPNRLLKVRLSVPWRLRSDGNLSCLAAHSSRHTIV